MISAVTGIDLALAINLSSQVLSSGDLSCKSGDNHELLNNLITHGDGLVPIHDCEGEVRRKRNRRKQKHGSRTTTHKKKSHFAKKIIISAKHTLISTMSGPKQNAKDVWAGCQSCPIIAMRKEDKTKFDSNIIELFDNVRSKSEIVPDRISQFKRIKFGENLRALFPCEIVRNNESCCISLDPSLTKHKHFIIVSTIRNLRRSGLTRLVDGKKNIEKKSNKTFVIVKKDET